jgi:hypothetical protein
MYAENNDFFAESRLALNPDPHFSDGFLYFDLETTKNQACQHIMQTKSGHDPQHTAHDY